jgi:hypothetical protein
MHLTEETPQLPKLRIQFPDFLLGEMLPYEHTSRYDDIDQGGEVGTGISLRYGDTPFMKVDIFEYDLARTDLGTGIESKVACAEFFDAQASLIDAAQRGLYRFATILGQDMVTIPGDHEIDWFRALYVVGKGQSDAEPEALFKKLEGTDEVCFFTFIGLTLWRGQFIKVRFTRIYDESQTASELFEAILTLISHLMRGDTTREAIHAEYAQAELQRKATFHASFEKLMVEGAARITSEVETGERCPKCGMAYGWDGVKCSRCDKASSFTA